MSADREPQIPLFTSMPGIQVALPNDLQAGDITKLFHSDDFLNLLVTQANLHPMQYIRNNQNLTRHSQAQSWFDTTRSKIKTFFALGLILGIVRKLSCQTIGTQIPYCKAHFSTVLFPETVTILFNVFCILLIIPGMVLMMPIGTSFTKSGYLWITWCPSSKDLILRREISIDKEF